LIHRHRAIFISDVHLGTRGCQAEKLLDFLRLHDAETIYLVGDIVDGWQLKRSWYWPQPHNDVVQKLLRKARKGARIVYVPGNHDEAFRDYVGTHFGGVEVMPEAVHVTADGKRLWVIHGDQFDGVIQFAPWLAHVGARAYNIVLRLNTLVRHGQRTLGLPYWSLSAYLKHKVKNAVQFIDRFETVLGEAASARGFDGVVCGHIHHAEVRRFGPVLYVNDGDWVESCTAVVEKPDGALEIVRWTEISKEATPADDEEELPFDPPIPVSAHLASKVAA
jgi:UDP-2,3-diacylglucosamine pyrophosphatase LpxH